MIMVECCLYFFYLLYNNLLEMIILELVDWVVDLWFVGGWWGLIVGWCYSRWLWGLVGVVFSF